MHNFSLDPSVDNYGVMGNPVTHSKSPQIHTAFAEQTNQHLNYQAILVELDQFPEALDIFQQQGGKGLNITVPFKGDAWASCQSNSQRADRAQAVNTLWFKTDGSRCGDNTDGIGLIRDLTINHQVTVADRGILILGAGGAVRGILDPLFDQQPAQITIANRTLAKGKLLADLFSDRGDILACSYDDLAGKRFQLVINGTSASLQGEVPPLPDDLLASDACCYDMMYSNNDTAFVNWAKSHHASLALDGLGMLVEQAAESFLIWRGVYPDTGSVIEMLRGEIDTA